MQHVFVRTRLHAIIVMELLSTGVIKQPFHLVHFSNSSEPETKNFFDHLKKVANKVTSISRPKFGFTSLFLYFLHLMLGCRLKNGTIFLANINWYHFGLALKFVPGLRIATFDDGTANVQRNSVFFTDKSLELNSMRGRLARFIFPGGVARFTRSRIETHYTIYPGLDNVVDQSRLRSLRIDWKNLIEPDDVVRLPGGIRKILLGTVYAEASHFLGMDFSEELIEDAVAWADLYLPHPRQQHDAVGMDVSRNYPAEAMISYYAGIHDVVVAHFNSSASIPFGADERVRLVDISTCKTPGEVRNALR